MTFAARVCENYTDIFANLNRNNILESLKDLGPDSQYIRPGGQFAGQLVNPTAESIPPQNACVPLAGWRFSLGRGHRVRAVSGPWGSLAIVLNPFTSRIGTIVTQAQTPLLDDTGIPIAGQQLAGATTIELTEDEVHQAVSGQLWVQGGTPTDPILASEFGSGGEPQYGFGALRCASDKVNADNVEFIYFPEVLHVFCYEFLVKPPPTSGTITIRKVVEGAPQTPAPVFPFNGSLSFDPGGFSLRHNQSQTFYRAGGVSWGVTAGQVAGYEPVGPPNCTAIRPSGGAASSTSSVTESSATIQLAAEEHVTCVFVSRPRVAAPGTLTIRKVTRGGVGTFDYTITRTGGGVVAHSVARTTLPEVPVYALPSPISLTAGHYVIHEVAHDTPDGVWRPALVICNGHSRPAARTVDLHVVSGEAITCTFENVFELLGSISVAKVTIGGIGTAQFLIQPFEGPTFENPTTQFRKHSTTTTQHHPHPASPIEPHDATTHLPLGYYWISSQPPITTEPTHSVRARGSRQVAQPVAVGEWELVSVEVNGLITPFTQGATSLHLTPTTPHVHVVFTSLLTPAKPHEPELPGPEVPPPPVPKFPPSIFPPEVPGRPAYPLADLSVTKSASATAVSAGQVVHYHVTVTDHGPDVARQVVIDDQALGAVSIVAVHTPVGHCQIGRPIVCELGAITAGHSVTITVALRALPPGATLVNRAVVGEASQDPNLATDVSEARVRVRRLRPPAVTG